MYLIILSSYLSIWIMRLWDIKSQNCLSCHSYLFTFLSFGGNKLPYKFTITTFFLLRDGRWLPLKALSTLRIIYQYSLNLYLSVCEFAYVWTCCMYPGCTVGTPDADSLWSTTVLFRRENVSSRTYTYTYTYTSLLGNTASSQCGSSYSLWCICVSEGVII